MVRVPLLFLLLVLVARAEDVVEVRIDPSDLSFPINPRFASYSYEYGGLPSVAGTVPKLRSSFFQLMQNVKDFTGSSPQFRIGGNSADVSWWNPDKLPAPNKFITNSILPTEIETIFAVTEKLDTVATLSVNFDNPTNASLAVSYMAAVPNLTNNFDNIFAIEIGNEVDLFGGNGFRPNGYNYSEYQKEFEYYADSISGIIPKKFIQGATFCCEHSFFEEIPTYVKNELNYLKTVSVHNYPTSHCNNNPVTLLELLEDKSSEGVAAYFAPYAKATIDAGIDFWVGEMNSASCGGAPNVSDVFGSALWAVDILFNYVSIGVKGVNFHGGSGGYYTSFAYSSPSAEAPQVRPIYYAQYLFAQAILSNSALITGVTTISTTNELIKIWAVYDNNNNDVRVVVIHKDISTKESANVTLQINGFTEDEAALIRVTAPSPYSETGIEIGSQTFDGTQTGAPGGNFTTIPIYGTNSTFTFVLPPASIAMLTIRT